MASSKRNTGKPSEDKWCAHFDRLGKRACYHRLVDASEITGKTGKIATSATAQPSDYILTFDGVTTYAEVKSTSDPKAFRFNLFKPAQIGESRRILSAGGRYTVFVHHLSEDLWYCIPMSLVHAYKDQGKGSIPWSELPEDLHWSI